MHLSMRGFLSYARDRGLSLPQLGALFQARHAGYKGITDLGEKLGVTGSAASQLLQRLVDQELVRRSEDPSDRRVKQVILTDKGRQILDDSIRARQGWMSDLAGTLSEAEKETVIAALNILIDKAIALGQSVEPVN